MTDQEKNGRSVLQKNSTLLDWAGFGYEGDKYWIYPDGTRHFHNWVGDQLPIDLYHSLDAQAKWLNPKLTLPRCQGGMETRSFHFIYPDDEDCVQCWVTEHDVRESCGRGATLAEACAEAILSLIGEDDG